ncbi:hypothetical protein TREMEDRAFT_63809 [Tremella mesenterica DSM 1558]|uniref:uncharacterized protein n=1 Tax=Tremella mesenterica (strain ATCC 24925 / CBS 8224 / DSM 1558 / NBRC 9311 / NRRL Y-6157 / RJB 2259-6 / UBC 559-6) TaxID=578456 RepID=UPI0003F4A2FA|nr:uncharacterized protein TREMEDRAFT_63809 [Tremella mesenterica DSM 1558]EIW67921.1 hypothetical protein TREMEDRAFT_63809 [Tremella mesenterica DSM 1558]
MQTNDTDLLFQTNSDLEFSSARQKKLKAAEKLGNPFRISSKVLDLVIEGDEAWVAESGWQIRRVDLNSFTTKKLYKGHSGPVTSVVLYDTPGGLRVLSGSWDKTIRIWDIKTAQVLHILKGHTDFVKSLLILPLPRPLLLSTSSDRSLRLWDLSPLQENNPPICIQTIREHTRPVESSTYRIFTDESGQRTEVYIWTSDSLGVMKEWELKDDQLVFRRDIKGHETSVGFILATEDGLWSASMDKSIMFHPHPQSHSLKPISITHTGYVKSLLPLPASSTSPSLLLTAGDDEDLHVFPLDDVLEGQTPKPILVPGHCAEVSVLRLWRKEGKAVILSGSLDGTIRNWSIPG